MYASKLHNYNAVPVKLTLQHDLCTLQLRELQAEKQIMEQQRDIANTERERVITESVNLKKKLEQMMLQRQKDAKDLSAMRHVKEKAFQVL